MHNRTERQRSFSHQDSTKRSVTRKSSHRRIAMKKLSIAGVTFVIAAMLTAMPLSLKSSPEGALSLSFDSASARIGRPLTPVSVAGVHRRAHRRAYVGAAAVGAAAVGAAAAGAYYAPRPACGYYPYPPCY